MEFLPQILNIPILQALGVVLLIGIAERIGIPIVDTLKKVLKLNGSGASILSSQMTELKQHYNHETTEILRSIKEAIENLNRKHEEWEKYGIPTRGCDKNLK